MKKHILGLGIFSFIFASFVIAFAYFSVPPIPRILEVEQVKVEEPFYNTNRTNSSLDCGGPWDGLGYEIINSQFFLDENKIITKVKLSWQDFKVPPKKVYLSSKFFTLENGNETLFRDSQVFNEPFKNSKQKIFTIVTRVSDGQPIDKTKNLYAFFNATGGSGPVDATGNSKFLRKAEQVLLIHGSTPITEK